MWNTMKNASKAAWGSNWGKGAVIGGGVGGLGGMMSGDGSFGSFAGGAVAGAGIGALGGKYGSAIAGKGRELGVSAMQGLAKGAAKKGISSFDDFGYARKLAFQGAGKGAGLMSNKHAGTALAGLGAVSAGMIGGSMMSSNRGY